MDQSKNPATNIDTVHSVAGCVDRTPGTGFGLMNELVNQVFQERVICHKKTIDYFKDQVQIKQQK